MSFVAPLAATSTTSRWRVHYGDAFFLVWAVDEQAAREQVERFGYPVTAVEPAPVERPA
ncbi:MAG TPA: hypothetical protein VNN79_09175 [Actinomycetota bacterium]|jgi:hypothetical protein|nr:hypothetical protein [Actinomycetota bacterium]